MKDQQYIKQCDADFRARLYGVADSIAAEKRVKIVSLSGPTCSGKTTAAAMLAKRLSEDGRRVHIVSIDDFYYDRDYLHELSEKKGSDTIDYDSADTIDLAALSDVVSEAISGETVHCPIFDFKSGMRAGYRSLEAGADDIFIFEGIQAIYPEITSLFIPYGFVSVYIAPMTSLRDGDNVFAPHDIRLLRRLVRDSNFRNTGAEFTLHMWDSVRANEEKNIFPFAGDCIYKIDSTHEYELGILKPFLEKILSEIKDDSPQYIKAVTILGNISRTSPIDASLIGGESLYREFV